MIRRPVQTMTGRIGSEPDCIHDIALPAAVAADNARKRVERADRMPAGPRFKIAQVQFANAAADRLANVIAAVIGARGHR